MPIFNLCGPQGAFQNPHFEDPHASIGSNMKPHVLIIHLKNHEHLERKCIQVSVQKLNSNNCMQIR